MGLCQSCLANDSPAPDDYDDILSDTLFLPQTEVDALTPKTPTVTPQTPQERGLSKIIVQQRPRRPSLALQTHTALNETTPLLASPSPHDYHHTTLSNGRQHRLSNDSVREEDEDATTSTEPISPSESIPSYDPFPQLDIGPFYQYAREMSSRQAKNMFWLRSYWEVVCASLRPGPWLEQFDNDHVTLRSLVMISESAAPEDILGYLACLVGHAKVLKQVADQYLLKPLAGDYSGLTGVGEQTIMVPCDDLQSGTYTVRNFWTALHIILQYTLPPNRSLKEYLQIFMSLQKCLSLTLDKLREAYTGYTALEIPTTFSLLVFLPSNLPPELHELTLPSVSIGFALAGQAVKDTFLPYRRANLPLLTVLDRKEMSPSTGVLGSVADSGLAETLAYTVGAPQGVVGNKFRLILVNFTIKLMGEQGVVPVKMEEGERRLVEMLRDRYRVLVTLDLAPPYKWVARY